MRSNNYKDTEEQNYRAMEQALRLATHSHAERGKVGIFAIIPKYGRDGIKITNWYMDGAWNDLPERIIWRTERTKCETDAPTVEESHTLPEVLHAEEMLVSNCARDGETLYNATVFITRTPCTKCAAHLIQAGIKKLYYFSEHPHGDGLPLLEEAGIPTEKLNFEQNILEEKYL